MSLKSNTTVTQDGLGNTTISHNNGKYIVHTQSSSLGNMVIGNNATMYINCVPPAENPISTAPVVQPTVVSDDKYTIIRNGGNVVLGDGVKMFVNGGNVTVSQ